MQPKFTLSPSQSDGYVYAIVNKKTGRRYVGQTSALVFLRWTDHLRTLQLKIHHCHALQDDWDLFGGHDFDWIVLEVASIESLLPRERHWIERCIAEGIALYNSAHAAAPAVATAISGRSCDWCSAPFTPRKEGQRYCRDAHGRAASDTVWGKRVPDVLKGKVDKGLPDGSAANHR